MGLGTVLLTYLGAKVAGLGEPVALSSGLFVALLPRELVVSSAVTNDALVIPLCALALVLFLFSERERRSARQGHRSLYVLGVGLTLGAAAVTKLNSLPVAAVLLVLALVPSIHWRRRSTNQLSEGEPASMSSQVVLGGHPSSRGRSPVGGPAVPSAPTVQRMQPIVDLRVLVDGLIAIVAFFAVSAWWFVRNERLYGQWLATRKAKAICGPTFCTRYRGAPTLCSGSSHRRSSSAVGTRSPTSSCPHG